MRLDLFGNSPKGKVRKIINLNEEDQRNKEIFVCKKKSACLSMEGIQNQISLLIKKY